MNEFDFVSFLQKQFPFPLGVGIGDDCSVVKQGQSYQLITKDILVEDVHFCLDYFSAAELAVKAVAVNVSDIVAMGGKPCYFYLGLGAPSYFMEHSLLDFFQGISNACQDWRLFLAGGDLSKSDKLFISITMIGETDRPVYRNNAKCGDLIAISGNPGESALALKLLQLDKSTISFSQKHKKLNLDIEKSNLIARYANAMIDVSDGLLIDLKRILDPSSKGAAIYYEKIPKTKEFVDICCQFQFNEQDLVLSGGEDYILLFTISAEHESKLRLLNVEFHIIGSINDHAGQLSVYNFQQQIQPTNLGFDHFLVNS
jgi:thiamine-monophosphate kinase